MPKVSVSIPVYNCEAYIGEAIDSVLNQTFKDVEIIVIDNQSTDRTREIVQKYDYPNVKLIVNDTNLGMLRNWHNALNYATGEYVKILAADDILYPKCCLLYTSPSPRD